MIQNELFTHFTPLLFVYIISNYSVINSIFDSHILKSITLTIGAVQPPQALRAACFFYVASVNQSNLGHTNISF